VNEEKKTSKKEMSVYALIVALLSGGGAFAVFSAAIYLADARWMTHDQHAGMDLKLYIKSLKRDIRRLEYKEFQGTITNDEKWELKDLRQEVKDAQEELQEMKDSGVG